MTVNHYTSDFYLEINSTIVEDKHAKSFFFLLIISC